MNGMAGVNAHLQFFSNVNACLLVSAIRVRNKVFLPSRF